MHFIMKKTTFVYNSPKNIWQFERKALFLCKIHTNMVNTSKKHTNHGNKERFIHL